MSKTFKYGERKNRSRKQRMKEYNEMKKRMALSQVDDVNENLNEPDSNVDEYLDDDGSSQFINIRVENIDLADQRSTDIELNDNSQMHVTGGDIGIQLEETSNFEEETDSDFTDIELNNNSQMHVTGEDIDMQLEEKSNVEEDTDSDSTDSEWQDMDDMISDSERDIYDDDTNRINGRRIVELQFLFEQMRKISLHNFGKCKFENLEIAKEIRKGVISKIILQCSSCQRKFTVKTSQDENIDENMCLNSAITLASSMIGIGFSQLEQFTSVIDVPVMSSGTFKKLNDQIGAFWEDTAVECMKEAAEEERTAAIKRGDVDEEDGIPFIKVISDECWSKRSYNKNYTALSGVASIVGAHTGKVLWIGVKNKYCVVCVRNSNKNLEPPPHFCTRNYVGSSSDMEWKSVLEGFQKSVELYNLRYLELVADGDSSTYPKLLEHRPYGHRRINKIECSNHLKKNNRKQMEATVTGCPRGLNKIVCDNFERIRKDICSAVQYRKKQNRTETDKILLLKSDLNNIVFHVFGDHTNCPDYIKKSCTSETNYIPALTACGTLEKMLKVMRKLAYCAKDLLLSETNNVAEQFNSIVAKHVGGKRINFSLSYGYTYQSNAAVVQFNTQRALSVLYKTKFKKGPSCLAKKIELRRLQKCRRERERRRRLKENKIFRKRFKSIKDNGAAYGVNCETTDLSPENLENEKEIFKQILIANQKNRDSVEEKSRTDKYKSDLWQQVSSMVVLSSNFGSICKARAMAAQVQKIIKSNSAETKSIRHERESEPIAVEQLAAQEGISIRHCGILIDEEEMCLAAAPSGMVVSDDILVCVTCPSSIFNKDPTDASVLSKLPFINTKDDQILGLKETHDLYFDIQGQLHIWKKNMCLFGIWSSTNHKMFVLHIKKDDAFYKNKMKNRLASFYYDWLLPELAEPRLTRNMEVRQPNNV